MYLSITAKAWCSLDIISNYSMCLSDVSEVCVFCSGMYEFGSGRNPMYFRKYIGFLVKGHHKWEFDLIGYF